MKEEEIRKRNVFNKYLELVGKDVKDFFDFNSFEKVACPACGSNDLIFEFEKLGFQYNTCKNCLTLFVSPRPSFKNLKAFYSVSPSTSFWVNEFFKPVAEVRRRKIFSPRAKYISKFLSSATCQVIGDIGAGFGLFLKELQTLAPSNEYIAIEPSHEMAQICQEKGFRTKCCAMEEIEGLECKFDLLTAFELVEHLFDPLRFFNKSYSLLKKGGLLYVTTLNGMGFDILLLWKDSKSVSPPHHLNFFNTFSIRLLLEKIGFEILEISTPGRLDWDIVEGMIKNEGIDCGRLWDFFAKNGSENSKTELQDWISKNNLSSHMRILAKKPNNDN